MCVYVYICAWSNVVVYDMILVIAVNPNLWETLDIEQWEQEVMVSAGFQYLQHRVQKVFESMMWQASWDLEG